MPPLNSGPELSLSPQERTLVAKLNLYYDLFTPDHRDTPRPLLIALHGYGGNKRQMMREVFRVPTSVGFFAACKSPTEVGTLNACVPLLCASI